VTGEGQLREWIEGLARLGGVVSAVEAVVADADGELFRHAAGYRVGGEPLRAASGARFDAASLTKPWMATLALVLDAEDRRKPGTGLRLETRLPVEGAATHAVAPRLEDLLRHRAGMPAWAPLAARLGGRLGEAGALEDFLLRARARREKSPDSSTDGARDSGATSSADSAQGAVYSDLGYLLWGLLAEQSTGRGLGELLDQRVSGPLALGPLAERSLDPPSPVECRLDNFREVELAAAQGVALSRSRAFHRGAPQDGNARALRAVGRFPAHAGLFVTADEMLALAREWLRPGRLLEAAAVGRALAGDGPYGLGWARQSDSGSSGPALSPRAFGHTGFTGGSLWVDPEAGASGRVFLLLAHRLASSVDFGPFRREFHSRAIDAIA